jgi:transposase
MNFQAWSAPVELIPSVIVPLTLYLRCACLGTCTGITFIDSTTLAVCKNPRIHHHKTFAGLARRGKTSTGWFYGFKLHLIVNDRGELLDFVLTPGNVDDRTPVPRLARRLFGKLFGDKGYLSKALRDQLWRMFKVQLITGIRANMKNTLLPLLDKLLLRRRVIVETIVDQLKNISQIEHSRHRSPVNFVVNVLCGLIAYCHRPRKPSLNLAALAG